MFKHAGLTGSTQPENCCLETPDCSPERCHLGHGDPDPYISWSDWSFNCSLRCSAPLRIRANMEGALYTPDCACWCVAWAAKPRHHQIQCPQGTCRANKQGLTRPDSAAQVTAKHGAGWTQPTDRVICSQDPGVPKGGMRSQDAPSAENTGPAWSSVPGEVF